MTIVLAFDRDWTVDVNPHPRRDAVPLAWVRHWAHETDHSVWAIGNQLLVEEADIPGIVEAVRRHDGDLKRLGAQDQTGRYEHWPSREERLRLIEALHPDASRYVVVDDRNLAHVDGWDHYHSWDFVPAVEDGDIDLDGPVETDGGVTPGQLVELASTAADRPDTQVVVRAAPPERPSARPLIDEPVEWFRPIHDGERFLVPQSDIDSVVPMGLEDLPREARSRATRTIAECTDPSAVAVDTLIDLLSEVAVADDRDLAEAVLGLTWAAMTTRPPLLEDCGTAMVALFDAIGQPVDRAVLESAVTNHQAPLEHVDSLISLLGVAGPPRSWATTQLMTLAMIAPDAAVDAVPALATVTRADDPSVVREGIYALCVISDEYPDQVAPARDQLVAAIRSDDENVQTNATAALGRIASNYPDAAAPISDDIADLLSTEDPTVRANAAGLLADIAQTRPAPVVAHASRLADSLSDDDPQGRIAASIALLRAGEADPTAVAGTWPAIAAALEDDEASVRANACMLLGNIEAPIDPDRLRALRDDDPDDTVRERAGWAYHRVERGTD